MKSSPSCSKKLMIITMPKSTKSLLLPRKHQQRRRMLTWLLIFTRIAVWDKLAAAIKITRYSFESDSSSSQ